MRHKIVGLGEILWDVFPERKVLGGAPANFAYHISQFGFDGCAVSAIGNDPLGTEILDSLAQRQLNHLIEKLISHRNGQSQYRTTGGFLVMRSVKMQLGTTFPLPLP